MATTPKGFYMLIENRVAATRWLAEKLKKDPRDLDTADFLNNRLNGLIYHHGNSAYKALSEAFPELRLKPEDMKNKPHCV